MSVQTDVLRELVELFNARKRSMWPASLRKISAWRIPVPE